MTTEQPTGPLERYFADLIGRLAKTSSPELELAARLVTRNQAEGNICLPLAEIAGKPLAEPLDKFERAPGLTSWTKELQRSGVVGEPGDLKPLILDRNGRLYLRRYWEYEDLLARTIKARLLAAPPKVDHSKLTEGVDRLFPKDDDINWQRVAATEAVTRNFCVITGGPGTGKTHTVLGILVLLLEQAGHPLRFALTASSGKAAARLNESIQAARANLNCDDKIRAQLPEEATTIHRLLGTITNSPYFRHNADNPLLVDALIVDEASMVDLAAMTKLLTATPSDARVILLGDKDQLTSVEAGYVLGDICNTGASSVGGKTVQLDLAFEEAPTTLSLRSSIVELKKNYRFGQESGIYRLVTAINQGDAGSALAILHQKTNQDVVWRNLPVPQRLAGALSDKVLESYRSYLATNDPAEALTRFSDYRVLCALRKGPYGVGELNRLIENALSGLSGLASGEQWYRGRPVMVTRNDHNLRLYNGDVGVTLPDPDTAGENRVFFSSTKGELRRVLPSRLPEHEPAYAMTVHKSQGSEFHRVLLVLPNTDLPLLTRELLYTALTRARQQVEIWAPEEILRRAIGRRVMRSSGLRDALWTNE